MVILRNSLCTPKMSFNLEQLQYNLRHHMPDYVMERSVEMIRHGPLKESLTEFKNWCILNNDRLAQKAKMDAIFGRFHGR